MFAVLLIWLIDASLNRLVENCFYDGNRVSPFKSVFPFFKKYKERRFKNCLLIILLKI
jgi:hypothetical protein